MPVKIFKPTTPSLRGTVLADFSDITTNDPEKSLLQDLKNKTAESKPMQIDLIQKELQKNSEDNSRVN